MTETQTHYEDRLKAVDVKGDGIPDSQRENLIKNRAREYVLKEKRSLSPDEFRNLVDRVHGLLRRQDIERLDLNGEFEQTKKQVITELRSKRGEIRQLEFGNIKSLAGLSHYIDQGADESMKILEKEIGIENIWKIVALTTVYTGLELGKGLTDVLKLGEGTAEGSLALDRNDLGTLQKVLELTKGVGIDGLRALALAPGMKILLKGLVNVLNKVKIPNNFYDLALNERGSISFEHSEVPGYKKLSTDTKTVINYTKDNPFSVNKVVNGEIEVINDNSSNLRGILEKNGEHLQEAGNKWLSARLSNIDNFVRYIEGAKNYGFSERELIEIRVGLKNKVIERMLRPLAIEVNIIQKEGFQCKQGNLQTIAQLVQRLNNIK